MVSVFEKILPDNHINYLLNLSKTVSTKAKLKNVESGSIYFTIQLPTSIKAVLSEKLGLDLSAVKSIPMRWTKGDTIPHIDRGSLEFENTYLVYLNNSPGEFILGDESYPIQKGSAFIFSEGICHETINTGSEPRLLLGPMSEEGFAVGAATTIEANGLTDTISFIYESGSGIYYRINDGSLQTVSLPITIRNTNTLYTLKVLFETDIIVESNIMFFICDSNNIQFGSRSLNSDGTYRVITINSITDYPGLIRNGSSATGGFNDIYVYNLHVLNSSSTLLSAGGWIGQAYFGKSATNCYIINCASDGDVSSLGGGIVGESAGSSSGSLTLRGCSNSGSIGDYAGGIVGHYAGYNSGSVTCEKCWSTNSIGLEAGGIFGDFAGTGSGSVTATQCYSEGSIGQDAGGIFGSNSGEGSGLAIAQKCYSKGSIGTGAGGIFGIKAGFNFGTTTATNCYSAGGIATLGNGIYGSSKANGTESQCYAANNSWNNSTANLSLSGIPTGSDVGTTWVKVGTNIPYELNNMGYTPYTIDIINSSSELIQTYSQTVQAGQSSDEALNPDASGNSFTIFQKSGGDSGSYSTITMSVQNGSITTTTATVPGTYTITLRSLGSYNYTTFQLTVTQAAVPEEVNVLCCSRPMDLKGVDYGMLYPILEGNILIGNSSATRQLISYSDLYKKQMAYASKH